MGTDRLVPGSAALPVLLSRRLLVRRVVAGRAHREGGASTPCRSSERREEPSGAHCGADGEKRETQGICLVGRRVDGGQRAAVAQAQRSRVRLLPAGRARVRCLGQKF